MGFETRDGEAAKRYAELVKLVNESFPEESETRAKIAEATTIDTKRMTEIATGVRMSIALATPHQAGMTGAPGDSRAHTDEQVSEQVSEQVIHMLQHCLTQSRTKQELLASIGLSNAYLNYKRHIVPLLEQGLIAMTLPEKPQSRLQRYRLTPQGQALLTALRTPESPAP